MKKVNFCTNKDKNVHRFALSAIRGELWEKERERGKEKKRERQFWVIIHGLPFNFVHSKD